MLACGCATPFLANDGTVVFPEQGAHGAAVVTANGLEFHDRSDVPQPVVRRDASEPWRAPIGFILPQSGRFTETSRPTVLATTGLAIALRPSDTRVPSWGGEVLVRVDLIAPAAAGTARWGENVALVIDGSGEDAAELTEVALGQLAGRDRLTIVDSSGRAIVPTIPGSHRSMALGATLRHLAAPAPRSRNFARALDVAGRSVGDGGRVVVLGESSIDESALAPLRSREIRAFVARTPEEVRAAIPESGAVAFRDVVLTFEGTPAPSHVLEASGGEVLWRLEAGELVVGEVRAGEARTEVVRVTVPAWVPGELFSFTVTAHVDDLAWGGRRDLSAQLPCVYDDDIERIANSRHGDVIAYSSALATMKRLDAAFIGEGAVRAGGLRRLAELHARSMALLARDTHDFAIAEQADLLMGLLRAAR
jgi:hypothetical protein